MLPSTTTSCFSGGNDNPVSPYLRRRLRTYAEYLRDRARRKLADKENASDPADQKPDVERGGGNDDRD